MEYIRQTGEGKIYAVKYDKHHNNKAGSTFARMVCTDRSAADKRSDDPGMVQRKRDQAQHVLQPLKKSSGAVYGEFSDCRTGIGATFK